MAAYGSFVNLVSDRVAAFEPEVGMGATQLGWSDRYAYTVVEVVRFVSGKKKGEVKGVYATRDIATRVDKNGMSDCQDWSFQTDSNAQRRWFPKRKNGSYSSGVNSGVLVIGYRSEYYDFSF